MWNPHYVERDWVLYPHKFHRNWDQVWDVSDEVWWDVDNIMDTGWYVFHSQDVIGFMVSNFWEILKKNGIDMESLLKNVQRSHRDVVLLQSLMYQNLWAVLMWAYAWVEIVDCDNTQWRITIRTPSGDILHTYTELELTWWQNWTDLLTMAHIYLGDSKYGCKIMTIHEGKAHIFRTNSEEVIDLQQVA